jgi:transcriptional regulator with XRE-family HTH domain
MDRRDLLRIFRERLTEAMGRAGLTQSALARRMGIDRSTLAQLMATGNKRLPRADTLAALAVDQQVSVDWLLGLTQEGPLTAALLPSRSRSRRVGMSPPTHGWPAGMPRSSATRYAMCPARFPIC